jgi:hypothetical protein
MPLTPPVPPRGLQMEGASLIQKAKELLEKAISTPGMGAETKLGQAVLKSLELIGRELPEGAVTPGQADAGLQNFIMQSRQQNPINAIVAALGGAGGGAPGAPGPPPGLPPGLPPPPTMPP